DRRASLDDFPGGETLATRDILFVPDLAVDDQLDDAERSRLDARGIRAVLVLPVLVQSRVAGVLSFSHTSAVSLSAARLRALRNLADQLAVALDNRRRLEAAQASATQEKTINSL